MRVDFGSLGVEFWPLELTMPTLLHGRGGGVELEGKKKGGGPLCPRWNQHQRLPHKPYVKFTLSAELVKSKKPKIRGFGFSFNGMRKLGVWGPPRIGQKWPRTNLNTFCHIKDRTFRGILYRGILYHIFITSIVLFPLNIFNK